MCRPKEVCYPVCCVLDASYLLGCPHLPAVQWLSSPSFPHGPTIWTSIGLAPVKEPNASEGAAGIKNNKKRTLQKHYLG